MPLAPRAQTHPQPARAGRGEGSRACRPGGPGPVSLPQARGWGDSRQAARRAVLPGRGRVWRGGGGVRPQWPRTSRSGNPLPHSLSLQLCRGLANGKRKLGQRKRRQTPRLENADKRRGPPAPAARPPGSRLCPRGRRPLPRRPRAPWRPAHRLPSRPGPLSPRLPPTRPATSRARDARDARAARPGLDPPNPGAATLTLRPTPAKGPDPPPPLARQLTWGGRGSGRGGIPTRQKATPFIGRQRRLCGRGTTPGAARNPGGAGPGAGAGGRALPSPLPLSPDRAHPLPRPRAAKCQGRLR